MPRRSLSFGHAPGGSSLAGALSSDLQDKSCCWHRTASPSLAGRVRVGLAATFSRRKRSFSSRCAAVALHRRARSYYSLTSRAQTVGVRGTRFERARAVRLTGVQARSVYPFRHPRIRTVGAMLAASFAADHGRYKQIGMTLGRSGRAVFQQASTRLVHAVLQAQRDACSQSVSDNSCGLFLRSEREVQAKSTGLSRPVEKRVQLRSSRSGWD